MFRLAVQTLSLELLVGYSILRLAVVMFSLQELSALIISLLVNRLTSQEVIADALLALLESHYEYR